MYRNHRIAVVIPCYRTRTTIAPVIEACPKFVDTIVVVDDCCPENTAGYVESFVADERVIVHRNEVNLGVGGAVKAGYEVARQHGADIFVKIDGDGQMDPTLIPRFLDPVIDGKADYTKGNRFFELSYLSGMPTSRLLGNAALSLLNKMTSGYWNIMDPTNGYTAVHARVAGVMALDKVSNRYFFESDMLFRLNIVKAVVLDIPMPCRYESEKSSLSVARSIPDFLLKHLKRIPKRIFYNYFLRDFNAGTLNLLLGGTMFAGGAGWGALRWAESVTTGVPASSGTVMVAALPVVIGVQFLIAAVQYDVSAVPAQALHPLLKAAEPSSHHKGGAGRVSVTENKGKDR